MSIVDEKANLQLLQQNSKVDMISTAPPLERQRENKNYNDNDNNNEEEEVGKTKMGYCQQENQRYQEDQLDEDRREPQEIIYKLQKPVGSLSYTSVKDFAYSEKDPLHYGITIGGDGNVDHGYANANGSFERDLPPWSTQYSGRSGVADHSTVGYTKGSSFEQDYDNDDDEDEDDGNDDDNYDNYDDILNKKAVALYSFDPENDNELKLTENQIVIINYKYGQGWLVAHDPETGDTGLIPEEYVEFIGDADDDLGEEYEEDGIHGEHGGAGITKSSNRIEDEARPFLPEILQDDIVDGNESDWVDEEEEEEEEEEKEIKMRNQEPC
ncbi:hypothetical protein PACTADRAFT_31433 [Pachysolen tannophilus NRRL Y-2460]|uniref:SH3 domain-containing protein n=1 Tax=Pachysolen tannophilus NRRL Y-2460 TaxID=669874 RepID=A0A1E4U1Z5_PACTA|nr:hypothetical protein PACTADRAFT_31433 [Pachysolen tannophilus NRRL Y-2460]